MADKKIVNHYQIIGTQMHVYEAMEPSSVLDLTNGHSTITTINGQTYGRIGTRRLPAELEALPAMSTERSEAVHAHADREYAEAYDLIHATYPETVTGRHSMGSIELQQ